MNILQLMLSLALLVFVHELGHYTMARLFGTRVTKFYLFFNPWFSLFKWTSPRSGTVYGLGWLPLGGYCQIAGMVDESMDEEQMKSEPQPDEFRSKPAWQRLLIMAGGIIFNLILALLIYISVAFVWGDQKLDSQKLEHGFLFSPVAEEAGFRDGDVVISIDGETKNLNVLDNSFLTRLVTAKTVGVKRGGSQELTITMPEDMMQRLLRAETSFARIWIPCLVDSVVSEEARQTGLAQGDTIKAIDGQPTPSMDDLLSILSEKRSQEVEVLTHTAIRTTEGQVDIRRQIRKIPVDSLGRLGVTIQSQRPQQVDYSLLGAVPAGYSKASSAVGSYVGGLKYIFTKEGAKSLGGLGTMAKLFPKGFNWQAFWMTTAFLSIILAVMNLLPIPALDGGHIVFLLIEMVTRRKLSDKVMMYIQTVGMILLLLLMLFANGNDVYRAFFK